jgi:hypothetical protein
MRSPIILALEIYKKLSKRYSNLTELREAVKKHILTEITQWSIKNLQIGNNYFFKPKEFLGEENSPPFMVGLLENQGMGKYHELKFGNLNASTDEEKFKWDDKDPYRLQKALFLKNVLETQIKSLFETNKIQGIIFQPYDGDGLGDERYDYFYSMYSKLGKGKYNLDKGEFELEGTYLITIK